MSNYGWKFLYICIFSRSSQLVGSSNKAFN
jgi:hypothetical protein